MRVNPVAVDDYKPSS